jgi:hypothetical protein
MIRPILEYGDIIFDGAAETQLKRLETVQRHAGLTCTGAYRHTKHEKLLEELGWPPLSIRRKHHRLNAMFKIQKGLAPEYLRNQCPPLTREKTTYNLRSGMNISTPQTRTSTHLKSFFPQTINDWNQLNKEIREIRSISTFKDLQTTKCGFKTNKLYQDNSTKAAINHTRIRLGLSGLSAQRYNYKHIDSPKCNYCNATREDPVHYFLLCPTFNVHRADFLRDTCQIFHDHDIEVNFLTQRSRNDFIDIILRGSNLLDDLDNKKIFKITQIYIGNTRRFI